MIYSGKKTLSSLWLGNLSLAIMKRMVICILFNLLIQISLIAQSDSIQQSNRTEAVSRLKVIRNNCNDIIKGISNPSEQVISMNLSIRKLTNQAIDVIESNISMDIRSEFVQSLGAISLYSETAKKIGVNQQITLLIIINKDLEIKFDPTKGAMSSSTFAQLATVTIKTIDNKGEVKNLRVHYAPLGFDIDFKKDYFTFPQLSSPVTADLVPGYYLFFIKNEQGAIISKLNQEIYPSKKNEIDLKVN